MKSNRLLIGTRLPGLCGWRIRLFLAFLLIVFPSACRAKSHYVDLSWKAPSSSPIPIVGYNIYRSADGGLSYVRLNASPITETKYRDGLIDPSRNYRYVVRSVSAKGVESTSSNTFEANFPE
jgi:fibronectin type 3 domain-containing protein